MSGRLILNLDGDVLKNKGELHNTIAWQLHLPDHYGHNLDALWDVLSTWSSPLQIEVTKMTQLQMHLEDYAEALLQTLQDAAEENAMISLHIEA